MSTPRRTDLGKKTWLKRLAKAALSVVVLVVVLSQITWNDHVTLNGGITGQVLGRTGDTLTIQVPSQPSPTTTAINDTLQIVPGMRTLLRQARAPWFLVALALQATLQVFLVIRWQILLTNCGQPAPLSQVAVWYCRAQALGSLLFGQFGSDVIRIQQSSGGGCNPVVSAGVVVAERILGFVALLALSTWGFVRLYAGSALPLLLSGGCIFLLFLTAVFVLMPRWLSWASGKPFRSRAGKWISRLAADSQCCFRQLLQFPVPIVPAILLTMGIHLSAITLYVAVDRGLGCGNSWALYLATIPIVSVLACLPSLNGLFVFEGSVVLLLHQLGQVPVTQSLTICAAIRVIDLLCRLIQSVSIWVSPTPTSIMTAQDRALCGAAGCEPAGPQDLQAVECARMKAMATD